MQPIFLPSGKYNLNFSLREVQPTFLPSGKYNLNFCPKVHTTYIVPLRYVQPTFFLSGKDNLHFSPQVYNLHISLPSGKDNLNFSPQYNLNLTFLSGKDNLHFSPQIRITNISHRRYVQPTFLTSGNYNLNLNFSPQVRTTYISPLRVISKKGKQNQEKRGNAHASSPQISLTDLIPKRRAKGMHRKPAQGVKRSPDASFAPRAKVSQKAGL
uniref:Uncharacterized protein n=1 Tax=Sphaerodactylus townsendi TaxID=933632 RepID=A0ACB8EAF0_9SAUR